ncbi:MAG TPA: exodeoxyribonuclease VII small subunit [Gaiellaceae bacterium]|jgi:exodeoxyribonuclease VII small subunit|nr:exodeoxyribonuclease VII small subunit [Gaiellaceae bacterium]
MTGDPGAAAEQRQPTFESAQRELERIVERLESGEASLDEAIELWERGEELYRFCLARLDAAHGRIEELARTTGTATALEER